MVYLYLSRSEHHLRLVLICIVRYPEAGAQSGGHGSGCTHDEWLLGVLGDIEIGVAFKPYHPVDPVEIVGHTQLAGTVEKGGTAVGQGELLALAGSRLHNGFG